MTRIPARRTSAWVAALGLALAGTPLATVPPAAASSSGLVISEVYGGGGNSGAPYTNEFV